MKEKKKKISQMGCKVRQKNLTLRWSQVVDALLLYRGNCMIITKQFQREDEFPVQGLKSIVILFAICYVTIEFSETNSKK